MGALALPDDRGDPRPLTKRERQYLEAVAFYNQAHALGVAQQLELSARLHRKWHGLNMEGAERVYQASMSDNPLVRVAAKYEFMNWMTRSQQIVNGYP